MVSVEQFWWTNLTSRQRRFIWEWFEKDHHGDMLISEMIHAAYEKREEFHNMPDWPAAEMRQV